MAGEEELKCIDRREHEWRIRAAEEAVKELPDIKERIRSTEESTKSAHHRLDDMKALTTAVFELAKEIRGIASGMTELLSRQEKHGEELEKHSEKINTLENAPGRELVETSKLAKNKMIEMAVSAVFGAVIVLIALSPQLAKLVNP